MNLLETLTTPQILHAAVVHFPIALAILGVPLVYLSAVVTTERRDLLWVAIVCYLLLTACAFAATQTGERAHEQVPADLGAQASALLQRHEAMAERVWIFAAVTAACLIVSLIRLRWLRVLFMTAAMLSSLATAVWLVFVAHYGGTMVYVHGVGTPGMRAGAQPVPTTETEPGGGELPPPNQVEELLPIMPIDREEASQISYSRDVRPILEKHCTGCHGAEEPRSGLNLTAVANMLRPGRKAGSPVVPYRPEESALVLYVRGEFRPRMPKGREPLSAEELHTIRLWISAGAIDDGSGEDRTRFVE